jgi:hypothetical protein
VPPKRLLPRFLIIWYFLGVAMSILLHATSIILIRRVFSDV